MKTILVTGGCGFIGSNFVLQEIAAGNKVINLDKMTYAADERNVATVANNSNYIFVKGDICDEKLVSEIFANNKIDHVAHFAAESHVDNSISSPFEFIKTNVIGTYTLLQAARKYFEGLSVEAQKDFRFLHVSTDEVFGSLEANSPKFCEETRYDPSSPYSASKAGSDHLAKAWHRTYGLPVIVTNCSNNFGPNQHIEKLIPKVITNCISGLDIPIYGNGKNIRDWIFVKDHCRGIKLAFEKGKIGETYCFGGDSEKTNNDIVAIICKILDEKKPKANGESYTTQIKYVTDRLGHDFRYAIANDKSAEELRYKPKNGFEENILETIDFYLNS